MKILSKLFEQFEKKVNDDILKKDIQKIYSQKNLANMEKCLQQNNNKKS